MLAARSIGEKAAQAAAAIASSGATQDRRK
jgi:hypothetical protein